MLTHPLSDPPVLCLVLDEAGGCQQMRLPHGEVGKRVFLGAPVTFTGCVPLPDRPAYVLVGPKDGSGCSNAWCACNAAHFPDCVVGPVVVVATDEEGEPVDVDLASVLAVLSPPAAGR